jgi:DNA polymerase-4
LFVIRPEHVEEFLAPLLVNRIPGVGKVMNTKLETLGVKTVAQLRAVDAPTLERRFGRYGQRLYELARGIDNSAVEPDRPVQSVSAEDTFEQDQPLSALEPMVRRLAEKTWTAARKTTRIGRTVVLKLKTSEFRNLTRSFTPSSPPASCDELTDIALSLLARINLDADTLYRLVGVGLGNFHEPEELPAQPGLFDDAG